MYYYVLTLDKISNPPGFPSTYENIISLFKKMYPKATIDYNYEEGEKQMRLHIHALISSPTKIYINRLRSIVPKEDYSLHFETLRSELAWKAYMSKDKASEPELLSKWYAEQYDFYNPSISEESEEYIEIPKIRDHI